ncbi:MAG: hypothetical protein ACK4K7_13925 [Allosphingosinicella sp.]|uniref:hypothetical protein n=1 Tax=Allosphingosinicella sp. TaxID=2823234 RepID=UPI00394EB83D
MTAFELVAPLVAIFVGLAFADMASSLHRLLRARRRVRWHWFVFSAAVLLVLLTLEIWWSGIRDLERAGLTFTIGLFVPVLAQLLVIFLLASSALPDAVPDEGIDLEAYYWEHARFFWSWMALLLLSFVVQRMVIVASLRGVDRLGAALPGAVPNLIVIGLMLSLVFVRRRWWHVLWLALFPTLYFANLFARPLL